MPLRLRLTLLFTSLLGGTLLLFGSLVYGLVSLILVGQVDSILGTQAEIILKELQVNSSGQFDLRKLDAIQPTENNLVFQVWGNDYDLQFSRPRGWQTPLDPMGRQAADTVFNSALSRGTHLRVVSLPLVTPRGPVGVLQVGLNLNLLDATQQVLASVLFTLAMGTVILAAWLSSMVINRELAPLATATQVATTITKADDLSRRIPLTVDDESEIGQLIQAFNETLSRLESLFITQRRFVADVSHELRTPLTVIKGEVELMRKMNEVDFDSLTSIESEVDRLTRLVGNLLLLAHAESGKLPLDLKPVELDTVLLEVFQQVQTLAGDRVRLQITGIDQVSIIGDRDRLKQVLLNLVSNAAQYTQVGDLVSLSLDRVDQRARFVVSDTGPGIPPEDLAHIFERFYRGEKSRARTPGAGFGLGLSIAYWIVRNHGGTIDVTSTIGKGTTFVVWLPLEQSSEQSISE